MSQTNLEWLFLPNLYLLCLFSPQATSIYFCEGKLKVLHQLEGPDLGRTAEG